MSETPITKRNFPTIAKVLYDFEQIFGPTERVYLKEGDSEHGTPSGDSGYVIPIMEKAFQKPHSAKQNK